MIPKRAEELRRFRRPRHFYVARPRLLDLLDDGAELPLTAVVAPPGAGKSVVLASWVRERCPDAAWVACEERHGDPVAFWSEVGAARHNCTSNPEVGVRARSAAMIAAVPR
jgi:ATP/maltotriose-dependent transcriptional regulator MalT